MWENIRYFSVAFINIDEGIKLYEDMFGLKQMTPIREARWGFRNVMMGDGQKIFVEIIEPMNPNSAVARFMRDRSYPQNPHGEGVYIIGIEVDDLEAAIKRIRDNGGKVTQEPESPDTAWVHPLTMRFTFIELHRHRDQQS